MRRRQSGFHIVVFVVIQSVVVADQVKVLQQLRPVSGNASCNCDNSIGDRSVTVVEVESALTSTAITTVVDKSNI